MMIGKYSCMHITTSKYAIINADVVESNNDISDIVHCSEYMGLLVPVVRVNVCYITMRV